MKKEEDEADEPTTMIEKLEEGEQKKIVWVGALLFEAERAKLVAFLRGNKDVFALSHTNMPGIAPEHAVHSLNIDPTFLPIHQKKRRFAP